jgi:predicted small lipoprotein YifL
MKASYHFIVWGLMIVLIVAVGCGVKGPPRPYIEQDNKTVKTEPEQKDKKKP